MGSREGAVEVTREWRRRSDQEGEETLREFLAPKYELESGG